MPVTAKDTQSLIVDLGRANRARGAEPLYSANLRPFMLAESDNKKNSQDRRDSAGALYREQKEKDERRAEQVKTGLKVAAIAAVGAAAVGLIKSKTEGQNMNIDGLLKSAQGGVEKASQVNDLIKSGVAEVRGDVPAGALSPSGQGTAAGAWYTRPAVLIGAVLAVGVLIFMFVRGRK